jgi:hypothetical protein
MSPLAHSRHARYVFDVYDIGSLNDHDADYWNFVRPAVFLKSGVSISGGNGSQSNPFVLG